MNEDPFQAIPDRYAWTQFFSRLHRYRNLFRRRWWVLVVCLGLALGVETWSSGRRRRSSSRWGR